MNNLHIGSGKIRIPGFVNIDIEPSHEPDICGDILTMDFSDIDVIFSMHMIEHLIFPADTMKCLDNFYRWLKPSGVLRIGVPDLELVAKSYASGSDMKFIYGADFRGYYFKDTPAERFNYFMKEWEHKIVFDYQLLQQLLLMVGFANIERKQPNQSAIPNFNFDRFISESLYVEAIK
jgi:predicted SAM-dependent methyltransferase